MADVSQFASVSEAMISELPVGSEANDSDQLEANQGGTTRSLTVGQINARLTGSMATGIPAWLNQPSSFNLYAAMMDKTGNGGLLVFNDSPIFFGNPEAPTRAPGDSDTSIATTAFVQQAIGTAATGPAGGDLAGNYPNPMIKSDVALSGTPTAPTATGSSPNDIIVNKQFLSDTLNLVLPNYAPINSPTLTGVPRAPTPPGAGPGDQIATLGWVNMQIGSFNYAPLAGPIFTGDPRAPTPATSDNDTSIATTAMVQAAIAAAIAALPSASFPVGAVVDLVGSVLAPAGWVWAINGTIGNAASGATIRANADCANLFAHLWTLDDTEAPVSGGRGASAAADFAANKTIGGLDYRGTVRATFDSLGGTAAGRLTNLHPRNGMIAGAQDVQLNTAHLASHTHGPGSLSTAGHGHSASGAGSVGNNLTNGTDRAVGTADGTNAGLFQSVAVTVNAAGALAVNGGATAATGSGTAHNNTQSTRTVTTIIKL